MNFTCYKIILKSEEKVILPYYSGFAFRGLLGNALKKLYCILKSSKKECKDCILVDKCIYAYIFESPALNKENGLLKGIITLPHPFILMPEGFGIHFKRKGSKKSVYLTLFGKVQDYLPYIVYAFTNMGEIGITKKRGKFRIAQIKQFVGLKKSKIIYSNQNENKIYPDKFKFDFEFFKRLKAKDKIVMRTLTPIRIKKQGKFIKNNINLMDILLSLKRRVTALSYYYCNKEFKFPLIEDLIKDVETNLIFEKWLELSRFSTRQQTKMKMGGLMFEMEISGDLSKLYPYLKLAEFVHIGKNASFGLGKILVN